MAIVKTTIGSQGSHKDRVTKPLQWGDNSAPRAISKAYKDNYDAIFRKDKVEEPKE